MLLVLPLAKGQPSGYTLVQSLSQTFSQAPWMNLKSLYVKTEGGRLYYYLEYFAAIPNSRDYSRAVYVYMDTDRNSATGQFSSLRGWDYYAYVYIAGDNSSLSRYLYQWNQTTDSWRSLSEARPAMTLKPNTDYVEFSVDQQVIGYSAEGVLFRVVAYSSVPGLPEARFSYTLGSNAKTITVDGNPSDWGSTPASATFASKALNPAELEVSAIYVANDQNNLYLRYDVRGTPTKDIDVGSLYRRSYIYVDADDSASTGYSGDWGAEYYVYAQFASNPRKDPYGWVYRYTGTGEDWQFNYESDIDADFGSVLEFSVPLDALQMSQSGTISLYFESESWYLYDELPRPVDWLTYPAASTTSTSGGFSLVGLFGSEVLFLATVALLMLLEGVVIVLVMRRGRAPTPPPPP